MMNNITKEQALSLLDEIENFRRHSNDVKLGNADFCLRWASATIAKAGGFTGGRAEWTAILRETKGTKYNRDYTDDDKILNW